MRNVNGEKKKKEKPVFDETVHNLYDAEKGLVG